MYSSFLFFTFKIATGGRKISSALRQARSDIVSRFYDDFMVQTNLESLLQYSLES